MEQDTFELGPVSRGTKAAIELSLPVLRPMEK